jgi:hypothetical protein
MLHTAKPKYCCCEPTLIVTRRNHTQQYARMRAGDLHVLLQQPCRPSLSMSTQYNRYRVIHDVAHRTCLLNLYFRVRLINYFSRLK